MLLLLLAGTGTALATGLGAVPVFFLGQRAEALRPLLFGIAAGAMSVASVVGLLLPGLDHGSTVAVLGGAAAGVGFLLATRRTLGTQELAGTLAESVRTSKLVFLILLVHSLPEGLAIGTAYASDTAGLSLFVILAIALQNVPEGTSVAIPMAAAGYSRSRQFWAAVATSAPQPVGAALAYLAVRQIAGLLPFSFGFAAGAMLALVAIELAPRACRESVPRAVLGSVAGALSMLLLSFALGV